MNEHVIPQDFRQWEQEMRGHTFRARVTTWAAELHKMAKFYWELYGGHDDESQAQHHR